MSNFVVYDPATGAVLRAGEAPDEMVAMQAGDGEAVVAVPAGVIGWPNLNLEPLRVSLAAKVDREAEETRLRFVTGGAGQVLEYQEAIAQARAYQSNPAGSYPMLQADVDAGTIDPRTGLPVSTLAEAADLIIWTSGQWQVAGAAIRAARLAAKVAISTAANIAEIVTAASVDWSAIPGSAQ